MRARAGVASDVVISYVKGVTPGAEVRVMVRLWSFSRAWQSRRVVAGSGVMGYAGLGFESWLDIVSRV